MEYVLNTFSGRIRFWLQARGIEAGPLFVAVDKVGKLGQERLNPQVVHEVLTRRAKEVGMEGVSIAAIRDLAQRKRTELISFGWRDRDERGRVVCLPL